MNQNDTFLFQDRCCIRLSKTFIFNSESLTQRNSNVRLCFGYFDALEIEHLPSNNDTNWLETIWLQEIRKSQNITTELYKHPLYIMAQGDKKWMLSTNAFWENETNYLLVSLAHFLNPAGEGGAYSEDRFEKVKGIISTIVSQYDTTVEATFYHSIDLSDMVIIWKTNYLNKAMECLKQVYAADVIGDMHTICAFTHHDFASTDEGDDRLDYVSFRFNVKDADAAKCFFSILRNREQFSAWFLQEPFLTIGSEDVDFVCHNVLPSHLQNFMYALFNDSELNKYFTLAFNESLTHIGIALDIPAPQEKKYCYSDRKGSYVDKSLSTRCQTLFTYFKELRTKLTLFETEPNYSWLKQVSVQLNALINMSQLCVLDRFCYLMLDSVQSFCEILGRWVQDGTKINASKLTLIQKYVRSWGILMDQTVRADGQFTQNIGVSPAFYDIPVSLLEFYIAFTRRCISFLQSMDKHQNQNYYALFLMPNLCRRAKVQDVFQKNSPPTDRLLYVDIPLDHLYKPRMVILQLCHEISHYCGETARCRVLRKDTLSSILSLLMTEAFQINSFDAVHQIRHALNNKVESCFPYYLEQTINTLRTALVDCITTGSILQWIEQYIAKQKSDSYEAQNLRDRLINNFLHNKYFIIAQINQSMSEVSYLCYECYADISMIYLLRPSYHEYLDLYKQEILWMNQADKDEAHETEHSSWLLVQRIALVAQTISKNKIWGNSLSYPDEELQTFLKNVKDVQCHLDNGIAFTNQDCLPRGVLLQVSNYLDYAFLELKQQYDTSPELENLQRVMEVVTNNFSDDSEEYRETIAMYERKLLQKEYWLKQGCPNSNDLPL